MKQFLLLLLFIFACTTTAFSDDSVPDSSQSTDDATLQEMVISASKFATADSHVSQSVDVITKDEMEALQIDTVQEAVNSMAGAFTSTLGGKGQTSKIFIRGSGVQHTQYRFDDFPLQDMSDTQQSFTYQSGNLFFGRGSLDRIEVLMGTESTLYGSSAMGGVVSMYPTHNWDSGTHASISASGGNLSTGEVSADVVTSNDRAYLHITPMGYTTDGYNHLWYRKKGYTLGAGVKLGENTTLELSSLGGTQSYAYSAGPTYVNGELEEQQKSGDDKIHSDIILGGLTLTHDFSRDFQSRLKVAYTTTNRKYDYRTSDNINSDYRGRSVYGEWLNDYQALDWLKIIAGLEYTYMNMIIDSDYYQSAYGSAYDTPAYKVDEDAANYAAFMKLQLTALDDRLTVNLGGRYNYHTDYDGHATWDVGAAYLFETDTKVFANVATGYRTPSLYETYGLYYDAWGYYSPTYTPSMLLIGNPDLDPETSITYQVGVEQSLWNKKIKLSAALFKTLYDDLIIYDTKPDGGPGYVNAEEADAEGYELGATFNPLDNLQFDVNFTHVISRYKEDNEPDWNRQYNTPVNKIGAKAIWRPIEKLTLSSSLTWEDSRIIYLYGAPDNKYEEDDFVLMDLAADFKVTDYFSVFGKVNNLLNTDYTMEGYAMPGTNFMLGVRFSL